LLLGINGVAVLRRVMNLLWIVGTAIYVMIEKLARAGARIGRYTGGLLILWGTWVLVGAARG